MGRMTIFMVKPQVKAAHLPEYFWSGSNGAYLSLFLVNKQFKEEASGLLFRRFAFDMAPLGASFLGHINIILVVYTDICP